MAKAIVAICTYKRPGMLQKCLDSILRQNIPAGWEVEILILDNDAESKTLEAIAGKMSTAPLKVHYRIEPQQGIPFARNAACRESLQLGADWIFFLDDDEEAEPGWLEAYKKASDTAEAEAYTGSVRFIHPREGGEPARQINLTLHDKPDLCRLKRAATNNVMMSAKLLLPPWSMEFDTRMAFTGGSDLEFFTRLTHRGGRILFVKDAVVSEEVLESRQRLGWILKRQYRVAANKVYIKFKKYGTLLTLVSALKELLMRLLEGSVRLVLLPFYLVAGKKRFLEARYRALVSFAKAAGIVTGLCGHHPQPYKEIDGY